MTPFYIGEHLNTFSKYFINIQYALLNINKYNIFWDRDVWEGDRQEEVQTVFFRIKSVV